MLFSLIYVLGAILFCVWDAIIGFGFEFDDNIRDGPTAWLGGILWPLVLPCCILFAFTKVMFKLKKNRLSKSEKKEKIRIAAQKEEEKRQREDARLLEQIERELEADERENSHNSKSF